MPISIVDLGIVERAEIVERTAHIEILPTFVGCPALDMIRDLVTTKVAELDDVDQVAVSFVHDPPWSVDRITDAGRASLRAHGVTVPGRGGAVDVSVPCPNCGGRATYQESAFGPTRCRSIWYCESCRNGFEHLKRVE